MENLLKSKKLRSTPFRKAVIDVFKRYPNSIEISVLEHELGEHDRITLYRTIKVFLEKGLLHEVLIAGECKKYALCSDACDVESHNHNHVHFHCTRCEETYCLETENYPSIKHAGFVFNSIDVQASGVCEKCCV